MLALSANSVSDTGRDRDQACDGKQYVGDAINQHNTEHDHRDEGAAKTEVYDQSISPLNHLPRHLSGGGVMVNRSTSGTQKNTYAEVANTSSRKPGRGNSDPIPTACMRFATVAL